METSQAQTARGATDLLAIAVCTLVWGTTWYAITWQLGVVDPVISVSYRFALAALALFAWCAMRGETLKLTRAQHVSALGLGAFNFALNYAFVYWAEERVASAVVAVAFAALAFVNLIVFRIALNQRAPPLAWVAALLGVAGVAALSWEEAATADVGGRALAGVALALAGVLAAAISQVFAYRGQLTGVGVAASTGWAMGYGAAILAVFALATGREWRIEASAGYVGSLVYLALFGSVIAFLLYFNLARRRGYAFASYTSALTPLVAMTVSTVFEGKSWGLLALLGVGLVLFGQMLLLRTKRA